MELFHEYAITRNNGIMATLWLENQTGFYSSCYVQLHFRINTIISLIMTITDLFDYCLFELEKNFFHKTVVTFRSAYVDGTYFCNLELHQN